MIFRDESSKVSVKCQRVADAKQRKRLEDSQRNSKLHCDEELPQYTPKSRDNINQKHPSPAETFNLIRSLCQSIQEVSETYFLGTFVRGSRFSYLTKLHQTSPGDSGLSHVLQATSLASLSIETNRKELMYTARQAYTTALKNTKEALQSSISSRKDETLAAVLLLALFETLTYEGHLSLNYWNAHINGAMSLIALRGPELFESPLGLQLFCQLGINLRLHCVAEQKPMPAQFLKLADEAKKYVSMADLFSFGWLSNLKMTEDFTMFRASIANGTLNDPVEIILAARNLKRSLDDLTIRLHTISGGYRTVCQDEDSPWVFNHKYHIHQNYLTASYWSNAWLGKLVLSEVIYYYAAQLLKPQYANIPHDLDPAQLMSASEQDTLETTDLIFAMVPQFLPCHECKDVNKENQTVAAGFFLILPLHAACVRRLATPGVKEYGIKVLRYLHQDLRIPKAGNIAKMLEEDRLFEDWLHLYNVF